MGIKNIVFDMGGVLIDLNLSEAVRRFKELGFTKIDDYLDPYEQKDFFLELEKGNISAEEFRQRLSELTGKDIPYDEAKWAWLGFIEDVPQYKLDYLLELRKEYNVYLLSNTNPFVMSWTRSNDFSEAKRPITDYFDKIYASYEVGITKPDRAIFEHMLADGNMIPAETLFIDDAEKNTKVAELLGIKTYLPENAEDWREPIDRIIKRS